MRKELKLTLVLFFILYSYANSLKFLDESSNSNANLKAGLGMIDILSPGMGYSTDSDSYAGSACFNYKLTKGNQESEISFEKSVTNTHIEETFKIDNQLKGAYLIYSGGVDANYFNSIKETQYNYSINYYFKISQQVAFTYDLNPKTILNETGKGIYNDGNNDKFRIFCGDRLINSYSEGAGLVFSVVFEFKNKEDKTEFKTKIHASAGSFASLTTDINKGKIKTSKNTNIKITAHQFGGNPVELSKILSANIASCDLDNLDNCNEVIKQLINYSSNDFPAQFKEDKQSQWGNLMANIGDISIGVDLEGVGLKIAPSFINKDLEEKREGALFAFRKLNYYNGEIDKMLSSTSQIFYKDSFNWSKIKYDTSKILSKVKLSISDMYKLPYNGKKVYEDLISKTSFFQQSKLLDEIFNEIGYIVSYNEHYNIGIFSVGNGNYKCLAGKVLEVLLKINFCTATSFGNAKFTVFESSTTIEEEIVAKIDENNENQYKGKLSTSLKVGSGSKIVTTLDVTGNKIENPFSIKIFDPYYHY